MLKIVGKFALAASVAAAMVACGGSNDPQKVATVNTVAAINPNSGAAVVRAVLNKDFTFTAGVPAFGTSSATTLALTGASATPTFGITSAEGNASGPMSFGSCIFVITSSTFPTSHPLAAGKTVRVDPCGLAVVTAGLAANGSSTNTNISFTLGATSSATVIAPVTIAADGTVSVFGSPIGTVPTGAPSGSGG